MGSFGRKLAWKALWVSGSANSLSGLRLWPLTYPVPSWSVLPPALGIATLSFLLSKQLPAEGEVCPGWLTQRTLSLPVDPRLGQLWGTGSLFLSQRKSECLYDPGPHTRRGVRRDPSAVSPEVDCPQRPLQGSGGEGEGCCDWDPGTLE